MPDIETVLATSPRRYKSFNNLIGIIDCSKIFIETPKNLELQSATWSDYKHHITKVFSLCNTKFCYHIYFKGIHWEDK